MNYSNYGNYSITGRFPERAGRPDGSAASLLSRPGSSLVNPEMSPLPREVFVLYMYMHMYMSMYNYVCISIICMYIYIYI